MEGRVSTVAEQLDRIALADPEIPDADKANLRAQRVLDGLMTGLTPAERGAVMAMEFDEQGRVVTQPEEPVTEPFSRSVSLPDEGPKSSLWNAVPRGALQLLGNA